MELYVYTKDGSVKISKNVVDGYTKYCKIKIHDDGVDIINNIYYVDIYYNYNKIRISFPDLDYHRNVVSPEMDKLIYELLIYLLISDNRRVLDTVIKINKHATSY